MTKKHRYALFLGAALSAMVTFTGISGCEDDDDDTVAVVATGANCSNVCNRYRACFNASYDVNACINQCQTSLNNRTIVSTDVEDCRECVGENVCAPAYTCADACDLVIVVP